MEYPQQEMTTAVKEYPVQVNGGAGKITSLEHDTEVQQIFFFFFHPSFIAAPHQQGDQAWWSVW